ncbi:hypothetical protein [Kangiella sp. TOML190]|uniref:hypothetical protein n=1 Tax=Kangiella sp. TOML190 TaxID=2931351 RepID=UPI0020420F19|nr:hypothetical protein [Kangiella sp. TOML190]
MSNHETNSDKNTEQNIEQQLEAAYQAQSQEKTSLELDQNIMKMAQEQLQVDATPTKGFWASLFTSKKMKYGFSTAAALFMTVGIARFMVYLSQTPQSSSQVMSQAVSEDLAQSSDQYAAKISSDIVADSVTFESPEVLVAKESVANARTRELAALKKQKRPVADSSSDKPTKPSFVDSSSDQEPLAMAKTSPPVELEADDKAIPAAAAPDKTELAAAQVVAAKQGAEHQTASVAEVAVAEENSLVITGARIKADSEAVGVLDEAVAGYPLPEVWLEEIEAYLEEGDQLKALEEWQQLKNTYPEFTAPAKVQKQLEAIIEIGHKNNKK